jgi:hypothetical protein
VYKGDSFSSQFEIPRQLVQISEEDQMARLTHGHVAAATTITLFLVMVSGYSGSGAEGKPSPASQNASERTIEGVWRTVITLRNCQTGAPLAPSFRGLFTFHEGGTMSEFGVGPGSTPALRSPGHGIWQREHGWQDYSLS